MNTFGFFTLTHVNHLHNLTTIYNFLFYLNNHFILYFVTVNMLRSLN
jgi:hypothetical protein